MDSDEARSAQPRVRHAPSARSAQPRAWRAPGPSRNEAGSLQKLQEEVAQIFGTTPAAAAAVEVDGNDSDVDSEHDGSDGKNVANVGIVQNSRKKMSKIQKNVQK